MKLKQIAASIIATGAIVLSANVAQAAPVNLVVEGGGTPVVFQLSNGNLVGLWGFENRVSQGGSAEDVAFNEQDLEDGFVGSEDLNFFAFDGSDFEFPNSVEGDFRWFDALWVEWSGDGNLVFNNAKGGTATMGTTLYTGDRFGNPFAEVPAPGSLALLGIGLAALGITRRRQK